MGIHIFYLDDTIILAQSHEVALEHCDHMVKLLGQLGFILNQEKSDFSPAHRFTFLGLNWDTILNMVALPDDSFSPSI